MSDYTSDPEWKRHRDYQIDLLFRCDIGYDEVLRRIRDLPRDWQDALERRLSSALNAYLSAAGETAAMRRLADDIRNAHLISEPEAAHA